MLLALGALAGCGGAASTTAGEAPVTQAATPTVTVPPDAPPPAAAPAAQPASRVTIGLERLDAPQARSLAGKRVGLIANALSVTRAGRTSAAVLRAKGIRVVRFFAPEHGLSGRLVGCEPGGRADVVNLCGDHQQPTGDDLSGLDALVYDLQDVGVRFWTYISTMIYAQQAAARAGVAFVVLDRPNPLGGERVAGPVAENRDTVLSVAPGPLVHGLTAGEMARLVQRRSSPRGRLVVVPMRGWRRSMTWADTGRRWLAPSPSLRSAQAALLYPGTALLEGTNASEGRGTAAPFRIVGAPWARVDALLAAADVPGVSASGAQLHAARDADGPEPEVRRPALLRHRHRRDRRRRQHLRARPAAAARPAQAGGLRVGAWRRSDRHAARHQPPPARPRPGRLGPVDPGLPARRRGGLAALARAGAAVRVTHCSVE